MTREHDAEATTENEPGADSGDGDVAALERRLAEAGEPFARATVVRREPPVSANVGDRAVVTADGDLRGWIGGAACAQSVVTSEALTALSEGEPRLVGLAPDPDDVDRPGVEAFPMTCHSEGTLEVFVEPVAPATTAVVVGGSPVARSLARLAAELPVEVAVVDPDLDGGDGAEDIPADATVVGSLDPAEIADAVGPRPLVAVVSMGEYDARGVAAGVLADAPYVGLVASDARAEEVVERAAGLVDRDPEAVRAAVTNPAGVDVAARRPAEIAASILPELVDATGEAAAVPRGADAGTERDDSGDAGAADPDGGGGDGSTAEGPAVDPVCGMAVDPDDAAATVEHEGTTYRFCCHGCADSFRNEPAEYLEGGAAAT